MLAYLSGTTKFKRLNHVVLDVQGVGYKVFMPLLLLNRAKLDLPLELYIHTVVREDDLSLYGFENEEQLKLFELLLSVNGIGPRLGLDLFAWPIDKIKKAILNKEVTTLTQIPGIGKKTAERIILELREKLGALDNNHLPENDSGETLIKEEILDALLSLGYQKKDIERVYRGIKEPIPENSEEIIRYFLKNI
ncbi:MAG: Holliday junction DNA helicase RuvA, holliday junction DNA helicase RuvA [Candidatus Peregrinibacteria bacterium GW2011_GWE2_39_6]|nr:MAG: Holliday junction DNA helicase RuvA, holliday junction DNA helicase RuvA [Candidatus Peregrinibacteria bacterium GW2011_GWF2_39_17]KKR24417.1 MAG: Holliday junction DNA helicase RuvA, holliday junction DNA helicase RuvA [Candidatus Peregrinibacteria bacterium GW2011_GWE2_39_6]HCW32002.1 Holliday junction branch migration protein RuvA [Candidatus Peregrinibacteria bacterium]